MTTKIKKFHPFVLKTRV